MSLLKIENKGRVKVLTFCRPEASNAFNHALRNEVNDALGEAAEDSSIGAVVLTGEGKAFSAGIDLKELAALTGGLPGEQPGEASSGEASDKAGSEASDEAGSVASDEGGGEASSSKGSGDEASGSDASDEGGGEASSSEASSDEATGNAEAGDSWKLLQALQHFPKPLVMAVNGAAVGLGTTMLGFADLAFASPQARFKCPFTSLGVGAEAASTWLLPQLLGWQNAMWLLLSSEWVGADEAKEMGLVFKVSESFLEDAIAAATAIAEKNMHSAVAVKRTAMAWRHAEINNALLLEGKAFLEIINATKAGA